MTPTPDAFQALARSSPWLWRTLHLRHRDGRGATEVWVRRPGQLLARLPDGKEHYASGVPWNAVTVLAGEGAHRRRERLPHLWPREVAPTWREDGLVATRPVSGARGRLVAYDDPMLHDFTWVAMLDPEELSHHVAVHDLRVEDRAGRETWRVRLVGEPGYEPRCGGNCCELLMSDASRVAEFPDEPELAPERPDGVVYPSAYDVALDRATGVVVSLSPVGESTLGAAFEVDVLAVDADLDALFAGRAPPDRP